MSRYAHVAACLLLLVSLTTKGCGETSQSNNGNPPEMIVNGSTKIEKSMIGWVYLSKGPTDRALKKGLKCEWRIVKKSGHGSRFGIANGPVSIKFRPEELNGFFHSRYCRLWVRQVYA